MILVDKFELAVLQFQPITVTRLFKFRKVWLWWAESSFMHHHSPKKPNGWELFEIRNCIVLISPHKMWEMINVTAMVVFGMLHVWLKHIAIIVNKRAIHSVIGERFTLSRRGVLRFYHCQFLLMKSTLQQKAIWAYEMIVTRLVHNSKSCYCESCIRLQLENAIKCRNLIKQRLSIRPDESGKKCIVRTRTIKCTNVNGLYTCDWWEKWVVIHKPMCRQNSDTTMPYSSRNRESYCNYCSHDKAMGNPNRKIVR